MLDGIQIRDFGLTLDELLDLAESESKLETFLGEQFKALSEDERNRITFDVATQIQDTIKDLKDQLKGKRSELRDEQRALRDEAYANRSTTTQTGYLYRSSQESRYDDSSLQDLEDEISAIEDAIDELEDSHLSDQLEDQLNDYNRYNIDMEVGSEDLPLRNSFYDNGDVVTINFLGGDPLGTQSEEWDFSDLDGAGFATYADYQTFVQQQKSKVGTSATQNAMLTLGEGEVVKSMKSTSAGAHVSNLTIEVFNRKTNKTVVYELHGLKDGVEFFITGTEPNFLSEGILRGQNEVVQKSLHRGMQQDSVYDELNEPTEADKLSYVKFYDDVSARSAFESVANTLSVPDSLTDDATYKAYKSVIDILFAEMNAQDSGEIQYTGAFSDAGVSNHLSSRAWSKALQGPLKALSPAARANVIKDVILSLATQTDPAYFDAFFNDPNAIIMIEQALLYSDSGFSKEARALVMFLETNVQTGLYGGEDDQSFMQILKTFMLQDNDLMRLADQGYFADAWKDNKVTQDAMGLYEQLLNLVPWASRDGEYETVKAEMKQENKFEEMGVNSTVQAEWNVLATVVVDPEDVDGPNDGMDKGEYAREMNTLLKSIAAQVSGSNSLAGGSVKTLGEDILKEIELQCIKHPEWAPVLTSSLIHYMKESAPEMLKSLCMDSGFVFGMLEIISRHDRPNDPKYLNSAQTWLKIYAVELAYESGLPLGKDIQAYEKSLQSNPMFRYIRTEDGLWFTEMKSKGGEWLRTSPVPLSV